MSNEELANLPDVEILRKTDWSLWCRVGERQIAIPAQVVSAPRPLPLAGEVVTLVVARWFAVANQLL
jgi:hypothetical protein